MNEVLRGGMYGPLCHMPIGSELPECQQVGGCHRIEGARCIARLKNFVTPGALVDGQSSEIRPDPQSRSGLNGRSTNHIRKPITFAHKPREPRYHTTTAIDEAAYPWRYSKCWTQILSTSYEHSCWRRVRFLTQLLPSCCLAAAIT